MSFITGIPSNHIAPLAWLGKRDWLVPTENGCLFHPGEPRRLTEAAKRLGTQFAKDVEEVVTLITWGNSCWANGSSDDKYPTRALVVSKVLASGQKTLSLTSDWCEAFENTEVTINGSDYRQPFPAMVVEFPPDYARSKLIQGTSHYPERIGCFYYAPTNILLIQIQMPTASLVVSTTLRPDESVEFKLKKFGLLPGTLADIGVSSEFDLPEYLLRCNRIAINAIVAMSYGTDWQNVKATPSQRRKLDKLKKQVRSRKSPTSRRARILLGCQAEFFSFDQTVQVFEEQVESSSPLPSVTGTPKKPHWRRGHWRRQAVGKGRKEIRLTWIRPMLIKATLFKGDLKDTSTTYKAK